jgi:hypothetical protein
VEYTVRRDPWYNIIVLNVHAPSEKKGDTSKNSLYEELEEVFEHYSTIRKFYGNFNAKVGRDNIFKPTIENANLHQDCNANGARIVKFATSKNLFVKARCSRTETFIIARGPILMERLTTRLNMY